MDSYYPYQSPEEDKVAVLKCEPMSMFSYSRQSWRTAAHTRQE